VAIAVGRIAAIIDVDAGARPVIAAAIAIIVAVAAAIIVTIAITVAIAAAAAVTAVTIARLRARVGWRESDGRADRHRRAEDKGPEHTGSPLCLRGTRAKNAARTVPVSTSAPERAMNGMVNPLKERAGVKLAQTGHFPPHSAL